MRPLDITNSETSSSTNSGGTGAFHTSISTFGDAKKRLVTTSSEQIIESISFDASKTWTGVNIYID